MMKKVALGAGVVVLVLVFLIAKDWDSPELGRTLLSKATDATGVEITAEGFRLNLLRGLTLENVNGSSTSDDRELTFSLDRLVFEHRVLPLLSGTVAIDRVVLESPNIEVVDAADGSAGSRKPKAEPEPEPEPADAEPAAGADDSGGLALEIREIRIENGTLVMKKKGESGNGTRVEGLDFRIDDFALDPQAGSLAGLSAEGSLAIADVTFDTLHVTDTESRFTLADAVFDMPELRFRTPQGPFTAAMKVDFNPTPFAYTLDAQGDPLDVNEVMGAEEGFGPARVQMKAEGSGAESKDVTADGGFRLTEGRFPETEMFSGIDKAVGKNAIAGVPYEATEASFHLENNRLVLAPFRFTSENARLDLSGWVDLAGPIELKLALATPREGVQIEGIGASALDLLADDEGWVPIPIAVTGTLEKPRVLPDARALASQAGQGAKREVQERATDALKGLIRRKK